MTALNIDAFGSESFATTLIRDGDFDRKAFKLAYGNGQTQPEEDFGFRFAYSLVIQTAKTLSTAKNQALDPVKNTELRDAIARFSLGAFNLNDDLFTFAFDYLKSTLAESIPDWSHTSNGTMVSLSMVAKKCFAIIISQSRDFTSDQRNVLIDALSDADRFYKGSMAVSHKNETRLERAKAMFVQSELAASTPNATEDNTSPALRI